MKNNEKGLTLVKSLIVYIIVLTLLGVFISLTIADNGLVNRFKKSEVIEINQVEQENEYEVISE